MKIESGAREVDSAQLSDTPPADEQQAQAWAYSWATRRAKHKSTRDYAEADRIRELLRKAGWEARDKPDGSVEVVRIRRAS
jgi:cysteinyl-tRNA synthetase